MFTKGVSEDIWRHDQKLMPTFSINSLYRYLAETENYSIVDEADKTKVQEGEGLIQGHAMLQWWDRVWFPPNALSDQDTVEVLF